MKVCHSGSGIGFGEFIIFLAGKGGIGRFDGGGVIGCGYGWGARGECVGRYGQGEEGLVAGFCKAEGGTRGGEGGAEGAVEMSERNAKVDGVVLGGGLDAVGFEDGVLLAVKITY